MKYLPIRELETVTSALNFHTSDCHVVGGCDLYTTKAAGSEKKLYKSIESSLESQHESLVRLSKSLSPPNGEYVSLNLARPSPFGPLSDVSARRTFAYLIATLNASHPDYDFSQLLRPSDFKREKSLSSVMRVVDETLYSLRPRPSGALLAGPATIGASGGPHTPGGSQIWGPRMWKLVDKETNLRECDIYLYSPDEDPFDGEESAIWSLHYFFFNKDMKRVCYFYLRGLSNSSHSPARTLAIPGKKRAKAKRARPISRQLSANDKGASKRARYWLGDRAEHAIPKGSGDSDGEEVQVIEEPGDDEVDVDDYWETRGISSAYVSESDSGDEDDDEIEGRLRQTSKKNPVRRMREHIAESMEV